MSRLAKECAPRSISGLRRDRHRRLRCEPLEDRRMLSVFFVDDDAPAGGDGLEWSSAFDDLDAALYRAAAANDDADPDNDVDAIWIAEGVYIPKGEWTSGSGCVATFYLQDGVTLCGGFEGTETTLEDRCADPKVHETILSGEIGMPNDAWDNVSTVVFCRGLITAGLEGLTISGGYDVPMPGSYHLGNREGAGIWSHGTLIVSNCTITDNEAETGAGIWNSGTMRLIDSTVQGNTAVIAGGGIYNEGTLEIECSTISDNESGSDGGGISNAWGDLTITGSTVSGNTIRGYIDADSNYGAGIDNSGNLLVQDCRVMRNVINAYVDDSGDHGNFGGGIANRGGAEVRGTLIVGNHVVGADRIEANQGAGIWNSYSRSISLTNTTVTYNVCSYDLFPEITNDGELTLRNSIVYSDLYGELGGCGTITASNSLIGIDPLFVDPYAYDFRLTEASPAVNIGDSAFVDGTLSAQGYPLVETDLAGNPRTYGDSVDAGAYEFQAEPSGDRETPSTRVTIWDDVFDPYDGEISLREAIWYAEDGAATTITFDEDFARFRCRLEDSALLIDRSLTIDASSLEYCQIDAGNDSRVLLVLGGEDCEVTLKGVTLRRGYASHGGGIYNTATLTLENSVVESNNAQKGGGVFNRGALRVRDSVFGGNEAWWSAAQGGAIYNAGTLDLIGVAFDANGRWYAEGGAIYNCGTANIVNGAFRRCEAANGGAVFNAATLNVANSTFTGCSAVDDGGALYLDSGHAVLQNSTIATSEAKRGGGVFISSLADVLIQNTIVARNSATEQGPDLLAADGVLSGSYNLIGDGTGQDALSDGVDGNLVGTADAPIDPVFLRDPTLASSGTSGSYYNDQGDFGLRWTSPAIDAGDNSLLPADTYDLDADGDTTEPIPIDAEGNERIQNGTINIGAIEHISFNAPPTAEGDAYTLDEDECLVVDADLGTLLDNDADADDDFLTTVIIKDVSRGVLRFNDNGTFVYHPQSNWSGVDSFKYQAYDGEEMSPIVTVTLTVRPANDAPLLDALADQAVDAGAALSFTLTGTDPDERSPADLVFSAANLPEGAALDSETGEFSWTPQETQVGEYDVTFIGTDKGTPPLSDSWTVHISVLEPHAAPILHPEPETTEGSTNEVSWEPVPGATGYWVQCDDDPEFGSIEMESGWIDATSFEFTGLHPYTTYYYRVKSRRQLTTPAEYSWGQSTQADFEDEDNVGVNIETTVFSGRVTVVATSTLYHEGFEEGSLDQWTVESGSYDCEITDTTAAAGTSSLSVTGGDGAPFTGLFTDLPSLQPREVRFSVRASDAATPGGRLILASGPSDAQTVASFQMGYEDAPGTMGIFDGRDWHGVSFTAGEWYDVTFAFDWDAKTVDYYVNDTLVAAEIPFLASGESRLNGIYLSNQGENAQTWWDEITVAGGSPTGIGTFTSETIVPDEGTVWDALDYDTGLSLLYPNRAVVSILPETGDTPIPGFESVYRSTDLSRLPNEPIRLRVVLRGGGFEPALDYWHISWRTPDIQSISNWSAPVSSVQYRVLDDPVLCVDAGATGANNGSSWEDAFTDLQAALDFAEILNSDADSRNDVNQIWIAEGTYRPSEPISGSDPRAAAFSMRDGVNLYGGFAGTETSTEERSCDPSEFETVLSGDIGVLGDVEDNAYSVAYCGAGIKAGVDGVTITGGNANGSSISTFGGGNNSGGGIRNRGVLEISNSRILDNRASLYGAGIYSGGPKTLALLTVKNSTIAGNDTGGFGGGICSDGDPESTCVIVENTVFTENYGNSGGGTIFNTATLEVSGCTFVDNLGYTERCSGIQNSDGSVRVVDSTFEQNVITGHNVLWNFSEGGVASMEVINCTLLETIPVETYHGCTQIISGARDGGRAEILLRDTIITGCGQPGSSAISLTTAAAGDSAALTVVGCTVSQSWDWSGGAVSVYSHGGEIEARFVDSTIKDNFAAEDGGGIDFTAREGTINATVENCLFEGNSALVRGGAIYSESLSGSVNLAIVNSDFKQNTAPTGGAIHNEANVVVTGSVFTGNAANSNGGGILNRGEMSIANAAFSGNTAGYAGGAVYSSRKLDMTGVTIAGNEAWRFGGGVHVYGVSADVLLQNCLIAKNVTGFSGPDVSCSRGILTGSNNLIGDGSGQTVFVDGVDGNLVGDESALVEPRFVRNPSAGSDGKWGTADDDYGDLRLRDGSPAIDAGNDACLTGDTLDLDGSPRVSGAAVDIGAYEFHFGEGDLNGDGTVDSEDLDVVRANWGASVPAGTVALGDPNGDGIVDCGDLDIVRANWGTKTPVAASAKASSVAALPTFIAPSGNGLPNPAATDAALVATVAQRPRPRLSDADLTALAEAAWMRGLEGRRARREGGAR